jgi:hypothetical protein
VNYEPTEDYPIGSNEQMCDVKRCCQRLISNLYFIRKRACPKVGAGAVKNGGKILTGVSFS